MFFGSNCGSWARECARCLAPCRDRHDPRARHGDGSCQRGQVNGRSRMVWSIFSWISSTRFEVRPSTRPSEGFPRKSNASWQGNAPGPLVGDGVNPSPGSVDNSVGKHLVKDLNGFQPRFLLFAETLCNTEVAVFITHLHVRTGSLSVL